MSDPTTLPAHQLAAAMQEGGLTASAVTSAFLDRIASEQPHLHAFVEVYDEEAMAAAEAADRAIAAGYRLGPLHGVPVVVKDLVEREGRVTMGGSRAFTGRRSRETATILRHMIAQGMIVLGKTHTVEFAFGGWGTNQHMGTPVNPWDRTTHRVPGGSSSGTGVAVAARLSPWGIGTDTGGSVRLPAAFCGIAGLKTTTGRISTAGVMPLSTTLDSVGPLARCITDLVLLDHVLRGLAFPSVPVADLAATLVPELHRGVAGLRLARMPDVERAGVADDVLEAYETALEILARQGAQIVPCALPFSFEELVEANGRIIATEAYAALDSIVDDPDQPLDEAVRARLQAGKAITGADYVRALRHREAMQRAYAQATRGVDALLTPTTMTAAIPVADVDQSISPARFTRFGNYLGLCAVALPCGFSSKRLPLSLQVVCGADREDLALRVAHAFEAATPWSGRATAG
jgi:aspartyl-tRNA(Asn)/glutamyl-tRNA(Gln) amidotransferase subunit A